MLRARAVTGRPVADYFLALWLGYVHVSEPRVGTQEILSIGNPTAVS